MFTGVAKKCFLVHDLIISRLPPNKEKESANQMDKGLFEFYFMQISVLPFIHDFYFFSVFFFFFFLILFWWIVNESLSFFYQLLLDSDLSTRFASWLWVAFGHSPINSEKKGRVFLDEFIDMIAYLYGLYAEATRYSGFAFEILLKIIIHWKLKTIKLFSIIVWILLCINYSLKMWKFFSITF